MILQRIRKSHAARIAAMLLSFEMLSNYFFPIAAHALTTGPSQPEVQSFEPVGTSDMVDVFSGDYNYNIPLLDIDGYPVNISYNSGITMDQEASWVGLGWNINPGAVNRSMRGIPDDFNGDKIIKRFNMKPNISYGVSAGFGAEIFGLDGVGLDYSISVNYNNYRGVGFEQSLNMQFSSGNASKGGLTAGLGVTSGGDGLTPSVSFSANSQKADHTNVSGSTRIGLAFNSRAGLKNMTLSCTVTESSTKARVAYGGVQHQAYTSSANGSASIDFTGHTYTPQVTMPMINTSFSLSIKGGVTLFGIDGTGNLSGYYSEQRLERNEIQSPAFGYMNSHAGAAHRDAMLDVNREKEGGFTENTPALPITNYSYDVYTVNGQGVGGNYRPFRSDLGTVSDPAASTYSVSGNLGVEAAGGGLLHVGADVTITDVTTSSGRWTGDDNTSGLLQFRGAVSNDPLYEAWYFKQAGEKAVDSDPTMFEAVGASDPVRVAFNPPQNLRVTSSNKLKRDYANGSSALQTISSSNYRTERQKRNQPISFLPVRNSAFALQPSILNHTNIDMSSYADAKPHHIGEITTLRADGARYVYGLPAYNKMEQDVTFNVQGRTSDCGTGLVTYSATAKDNSTSNGLGIDNYYSMTQTPGYAHSYMLTAIISPDYVDYDATEGPSKGDLGTYTKFNYRKAVSTFKWRTPIGAYTANFNEGLKSDPTDNKGSYVYGEKEIWYLNSIETKNYVAIFTLSDRSDGLGVADSNGVVNASTKLKKLDRITLYSKPDYDANGTNATPIKTVHFEYDYSLCPGSPNSVAAGGGKLTLTKIYFTYSNSYKAKLSPYVFSYADLDHNGVMDMNFSYNLKGYDRWGNYNRNPASGTCGMTDSLTTSEFPYVNQDLDSTTAARYAAAWSLTGITLPSGGRINIDYEADDYSHVQDRKAMQMFKITNVLATHTQAPGSFTGTAGPNAQRKTLMNLSNYSIQEYYLFFKLKEPIAASTTWAPIRKKLLEDYLGEKTTNIYFRFLTDITNSGDYEYVSGYFDLDDDSYSAGTMNSGACGVAAASGGLYSYGWVRVKPVHIGDREGSDYCNPICKTAWQFGRLQLPRKVWDAPDPQASGTEQLLKAIAGSGFAQNILQTFKGPNKTIRDKNYGTHAVTMKSWIRLNAPTGKKRGGGSRVKRITLADNWKYMTSNSSYTPSDALYGQQYSYTTTENGRTISSGVATYEPQPGGDENPFRQPVFFRDDKRFVPDDESYLEEPFGEMFFPAPGVGYRRVEVRNLQWNNVKRHATGYTVQEFYSAMQFPTITRQTDLNLSHRRTNPILSLLKIKMKDYVTGSQGFVIELNDMHGKPSAQFVYAEGQQEPISEVHYFYKTKPVNKHQLDNTVNVIRKDGTVGQSLSGLDYDFVNDMREQETNMICGGINLNGSGFLAAIFPAFVPTAFPSINQEQTRFRSTVVTKVINRYGILERTEAHDAGSTVTTENLAWDAETGELLLTKTKNDFDDPVYNLSYPAHWGYDRMGQAYQNVMAAFSATIIGGSATITSASDYFVPGDELGIINAAGYSFKAWVCSVSGSTLNMIDKNGDPVAATGACSISITRSGRRNQQALAIGGVTLLTCPLKDNNADGKYDELDFVLADKVLNAKSQEYQERWQMQGGHITGDGGMIVKCGIVAGDTINPYFEDVLGVWRPVRSYLYLSERTPNAISASVDVRKDGAFNTRNLSTGSVMAFQPFWLPNGSGEWTKDDTYWTWSSEITKYTPFGNEVENRDALSRYSAAVFGYNNTLPVAVASNARYEEIGYDGFEDYAFIDAADCRYGHFNFFDSRAHKVATQAHTGLYSMNVPAGDSLFTDRPLTSTSAVPGAFSCPFTLSQADLAGSFSPVTYNGSTTYVLSYWVKATGGTPPVFDYDADSDVKVKLVTGSSTATLAKTLVQKSDIIEGWQQFQYTFIIPANASGNIRVMLRNTSVSNSVFFDDIRLHPSQSNMKSYVYHPVNLRFTYELDENNYATIYEYDEEGALIRVKKETANGIMTIKESRNNTSH